MRARACVRKFFGGDADRWPGSPGKIVDTGDRPSTFFCKHPCGPTDRRVFFLFLGLLPPRAVLGAARRWLVLVGWPRGCFWRRLHGLWPLRGTLHLLGLFWHPRRWLLGILTRVAVRFLRRFWHHWRRLIGFCFLLWIWVGLVVCFDGGLVWWHDGCLVVVPDAKLGRLDGTGRATGKEDD